MQVIPGTLVPVFKNHQMESEVTVCLQQALSMVQCYQFAQGFLGQFGVGGIREVSDGKLGYSASDPLRLPLTRHEHARADEPQKIPHMPSVPPMAGQEGSSAEGLPHRVRSGEQDRIADLLHGGDITAHRTQVVIVRMIPTFAEGVLRIAGCVRCRDGTGDGSGEHGSRLETGLNGETSLS